MDPVTDPAGTATLVLPGDVDLNNCEREAIHVPGGVQPHGALLCLDDDGTVVVASSGAGELLGVPHDLLGASVHDLLRPLHADVLSSARAGARLVAAATPDGRLHDVIVHRNPQGTTVVEVEPHLPDVDIGAVLAATGEAGAALSTAHDLDLARAATVRAVRRLTGYDRVMLYQLHEDGHGEVVSEERREDLPPMLGLHFPAADIPQQARLLYVRNWTRMIVDSHAVADPLEPAHLPTGASIDLSRSTLRAVSPMHLEYLRNMGVRGSMSLSLVQNGELVGLVACHHTTPRFVPHAIRSACELLARLLSEQLARAAGAEAARHELERKQTQIHVLRLVADAGTPARALGEIAGHTVPLLDAVGFVGRLGGVEVAEGSPELDADRVLALLDAHGTDGSLVTDDLGALVPGLDGGLLAMAVADRGEGVLAWCRPSAAREVSWGGDPTENVEENGDRLSPRGSFDVWIESLEGRSRPFDARDVGLARALQHALHTDVHAGPDGSLDAHRVVSALTRYVEELQDVNEALRRAADDREEVIGAVAHDLRSPLRTIAGMTEVLAQRAAGADPSLRDLGARVTSNAQRMNELLDGLQGWAAMSSEVLGTPVELDAVVADVLAGLDLQLREADASLDVRPLGAVRGDPVQLRALVQNLVENALKYRTGDRELVIRISSTDDGERVLLHVNDTGAGIEPQYLESVFGLFNQVAGRGGVGMGLAVVRRIALAHGGSAWVDSVPGEGSTFHVSLPGVGGGRP